MFARSVVLVAVVACARPDSDGAVVVRDSADVEIVDNRAPVWNAGNGWRLSSEPVLQIGAAKGAPEVEFGAVWGVYRLSNGHIVVGDQASSELRFFDETGKFLRRVGGRGQGPGQINGLMDLKLGRGDTLVAQGQTLRLTAYAKDGAYARSVRVAKPDSTPLIQALIGFLSDGTFLARAYPEPRAIAGPEPVTDSATLVHFAADGSVKGIVGKFPFVIQAYNGPRPSPMIFGPTGWMATGSNRVYVGFPTTYEIRVYRVDGVLERVIRRAWTPTPVTSAEVQQYRDGWRAMRSSPAGAQFSAAELQEWMRRLDQFPVAKTLPAHSIFFIDRGGNLWVRRYELAGATYGLGLLPEGDDPAHASVFDRTGRWLGDVAIPPAFYIQDIGDDYVLGTVTDSDGVQYVRMYSLTKVG